VFDYLLFQYSRNTSFELSLAEFYIVLPDEHLPVVLEMLEVEICYKAEHSGSIMSKPGACAGQRR
jgi:hypothetical protein